MGLMGGADSDLAEFGTARGLERMHLVKSFALLHPAPPPSRPTRVRGQLQTLARAKNGRCLLVSGASP
eukprot:91395-Rhodomonas_salina.3